MSKVPRLVDTFLVHLIIFIQSTLMIIFMVMLQFFSPYSYGLILSCVLFIIHVFPFLFFFIFYGTGSMYMFCLHNFHQHLWALCWVFSLSWFWGTLIFVFNPGGSGTKDVSPWMISWGLYLVSLLVFFFLVLFWSSDWLFYFIKIQEYTASCA